MESEQSNNSFDDEFDIESPGAQQAAPVPLALAPVVASAAGVPAAVPSGASAIAPPRVAMPPGSKSSSPFKQVIHIRIAHCAADVLCLLSV